MPSVNSELLRLHLSILTEFAPIIERLCDQGVPRVVVGQTLLNMAADLIYAAHGEQELRQSLADALQSALATDAE